jgi:hypothetical protein
VSHSTLAVDPARAGCHSLGMPEEPKETWEQNADLLLKINQNLQSLKSQPDADPVNKRLLQQVILLAEMVGTLNAKLKLP